MGRYSAKELYMNSSSIKLRNTPNAINAFLDVALKSKSMFVAYQLIVLVIFIVVITLESNNVIDRIVVNWVSGIALISSVTYLFLAPWISNIVRVATFIGVCFSLYLWW
jgi:hypothetical protein